jgi:hypothetical protein
MRANWQQLSEMARRMSHSAMEDNDGRLAQQLFSSKSAYKKLFWGTEKSRSLREATKAISKDHTWPHVIEDITARELDHMYNVMQSRYTRIEYMPLSVLKVWYGVQYGEYPIEAVWSKGESYCIDCFDFYLCDGSKELHHAVAEAYSRPTVDRKQDVTINHPLVDDVIVCGINEYESEGAKKNGVRCVLCNSYVVEPYEEDDSEIDYPGYEPIEAPDYSHYND